MAHKKLILIITVLFTVTTCFSQIFFYDDFDYDSYDDLVEMAEHSNRSIWKYKKKNWIQNKKRIKSSGQWKLNKHLWKKQKKDWKNFKTAWETGHGVPNVDLSEDGLISWEERFKNTRIIIDPKDSTNKIIQFEFNRIDPLFFAKYKCNQNYDSLIFNRRSLQKVFNRSKNTYCVECPTSVYTRRKNHMVRNEISTSDPKKLFQPNTDYWFGVNMYIHEEYEIDNLSNSEIVTQFHLTGIGNIAPPIALIVEKGNFELAINPKNRGHSNRYKLGIVEKEKWIKWVYHIRLSDTENGHVEVWKDDVKMVDVKGKNEYTDYPYYMKIGVYKWGWWDCNYPESNANKKLISYDKVWANNKNIYN